MNEKEKALKESVESLFKTPPKNIEEFFGDYLKIRKLFLQEIEAERQYRNEASKFLGSWSKELNDWRERLNAWNKTINILNGVISKIDKKSIRFINKALKAHIEEEKTRPKYVL